MIKETGKIIAIEKQDENKVVIVECISKSACSGCHNESDCGVGTVAKTFSDKTHQFEIPYKKGMKVDEFIEFQVNNRDLVKIASTAYLVPLFFLIGGALLAKQFYPLSEGAHIFFAVSCAAIGFVVTRLAGKKLFPKEQINSIVSH